MRFGVSWRDSVESWPTCPAGLCVRETMKSGFLMSLWNLACGLRDFGGRMNTSAKFAFFRFAVVMLALLSLPILLHAQSSNGTLVGTVTDASGSTVPSADVKAVSPEFGEVHTTKTDSVGTYRLESLQPGTYTVTFTASGFAELQVSNVIMRGSVTTTIDGRLEVGQLQKTVVVEASAAQTIDTQSGQLGA